MAWDSITIDELAIPLANGRSMIISNVEIDYDCGWSDGEVDWIKVPSYIVGTGGEQTTCIDCKHWIFQQIASAIQSEAERRDAVPYSKPFDPVKEYGTY